MPRSTVNLILVLAVGLGWGLLAPASKLLFAAQPGVFDGMSVAVARALWALPLFLIGLGVAWRLDRPRLDARRWTYVLAAGLVFGLAVSTLFTVAAQHTSVAHISFLVGISPVTTSAIAALVFRTRLDQRAWLALGLGVLGVTLLAVTQRGDASAVFGDLLMLGWLAGFGAYACLLRAVGPAISSTTLMCLVGTLAMAVLVVPGLALGYGGAAGHVADTPAIGWAFFGEVILGSTLIAQTAYAAAVRRMGVATATIGAEYTALAVGVAASLAARESLVAADRLGRAHLLRRAGGHVRAAARAAGPGPPVGLAAVQPARAVDRVDPRHRLAAGAVAPPAAQQPDRAVVALQRRPHAGLAFLVGLLLRGDPLPQLLLAFRFVHAALP